MSRGKNIQGQIFGELTAVKPTKERYFGSVVWVLHCSCGGLLQRSLRSLRSSELAGSKPSCGCVHQGNPVADITGDRYGKLTVIGQARSTGDQQGARWACRCDCGTYTIARGKDMRLGSTTSCGCAKHGNRRPNRLRRGSPVVADGLRFGMLTVLGLDHVKDKLRYVKVVCDCGTETVKRANLLAAGQTRSCGCLRHQTAAQRAAREVRA